MTPGWALRDQLWEEGQVVLRMDDEDGEIDLALRLADLLLEDGFVLEQ
jgi:hypothetical protein